VAKFPKKFLSGQRERQTRPQETLAHFAITAQQFSGPIPPPELLRKYEELVQGAADRIISMAEKQSNHRQILESQVINSNIGNERLGMILGFLICVLAISGGIYAVVQGKNATGIAAIVTPLVALVAVFIYGKSEQKKNLQARQQGIIEAAKNTQNR